MKLNRLVLLRCEQLKHLIGIYIMFEDQNTSFVLLYINARVKFKEYTWFELILIKNE